MIKGYERLTKIAEELNLPLWWVESVVVEYFPCREYLRKGNFWLFNFNKLSEGQTREILGTKVVFTDTLLFQNIMPEDVTARMFTALMGMPMTLLDIDSNILPNGIVSEKYFPLQMNAIDTWDQKLGFSVYAKIFDEGRFYQLRIAEFGPFHPTSKHRGWFRSDFLDLEPLRIINDEIYDLRDEYSKSRGISKDRNALKLTRNQVAEKYAKLEETRRPLRQQTLEWFRNRKSELIKNERKVETTSLPPVLTNLDSLRVLDGKYRISFHIEPLLYRAAMRNLSEAKKEVEKRKAKSTLQAISVLNEIEASALSIISSVTCLEAFINFVIQNLKPSLWRMLGSVSLTGKWLLLPNLLGSRDCFEAGKGLYNRFAETVQWRNDIVHYKFGFEKVRKLESGREASMAYGICNAKNAELAVKTVAAMIQRLSEKTTIPCPTWLQASGEWLKDISDC